ncbi:hypothetical protein [Cytobacillus horneckiae]|uniref:hypothetical protein n=1 Tax=Cytobacillus horneckiae TaxID=549687 RepID=UPI0034CFD9B8
MHKGLLGGSIFQTYELDERWKEVLDKSNPLSIERLRRQANFAYWDQSDSGQ